MTSKIISSPVDCLHSFISTFSSQFAVNSIVLLTTCLLKWKPRFWFQIFFLTLKSLCEDFKVRKKSNRLYLRFDILKALIHLLSSFFESSRLAARVSINCEDTPRVEINELNRFDSTPQILSWNSSPLHYSPFFDGWVLFINA